MSDTFDHECDAFDSIGDDLCLSMLEPSRRTLFYPENTKQQKPITENKKMSTDIVKYDTDNGSVELSADIIKRYLVPAGKDGKPSQVTDQEVTMFLNLCKYQKLNPFLREVYLIKYGTSPATMVTGKETFLKRAMKNPKYRGHETFITDDGKVATAKVYVENYTVPITVSVDYDEYVGMKDEYAYDPKQGKSVSTGNKIPNGMWSTKPKTMLKKVALVQALREAFPDSFGGLYSQEEISHIETEKLPTAPIETPAEVQKTETEKKDPPMETIVPEVEQPGFTPYVKGGENVKAKETPVEALKTAQKGAVPSILETSAKLKAEYLVSISNLKTLDNCKYLGDDMTKKAGQLTEADRTELKAKFAEKKDEIKAATNPDKAPEAPAKEPEILNEGDKVKVEVNGKVVIKGTIEKFGIVGGRRTVKLKESATPVFADLCTKE